MDGYPLGNEAIGPRKNSASRQPGQCQWGEFSMENQKWGCFSSTTTRPSLPLAKQKSGMLTTYLWGVPPGPSFLLSSSSFGTWTELPTRDIPRPRGPTLTCSVTLGLPMPRRSNRSQLSTGVERERAERLGSQETLIQVLSAANISHGTLDKPLSPLWASVS